MKIELGILHDLSNVWKAPELQWILDENRKQGRSRSTGRDTLERYCIHGHAMGRGLSLCLMVKDRKSGSNGPPDVLAIGRTKVYGL